MARFDKEMFQVDQHIPLPVIIEPSKFPYEILDVVGKSAFFPGLTKRSFTFDLVLFRKMEGYYLWDFAKEEKVEVTKAYPTGIAGLRVWRIADRQPPKKKPEEDGNQPGD